MSLGTAANTRVANELGSASAPAARNVARAAIIFGVCQQLALGSTMFGLRRRLPRLFTTEQDVIDGVAHVLPVVAVGHVTDGLVAVMANIMRGSGHQTLGAALNLLSYWCVGLPIALLTAFHLHFGVIGEWLGLASATILQSSILSFVLSRFDWQQEVERAQALVAAGDAGSLASSLSHAAPPLLHSQGASASIVTAAALADIAAERDALREPLLLHEASTDPQPPLVSNIYSGVSASSGPAAGSARGFSSSSAGDGAAIMFSPGKRPNASASSGGGSASARLRRAPPRTASGNLRPLLLQRVLSGGGTMQRSASGLGPVMATGLPSDLDFTADDELESAGPSTTAGQTIDEEAAPSPPHGSAPC